MFDEQPDGDPHGECAAEIHRLQAEVTRLREVLADARATIFDLQDYESGNPDESPGSELAHIDAVLRSTEGQG